MFEHSDELNELFNALNKFRTSIQQPVKDGTNPYFKSSYVTLDGTIKAIDKAIEESKSGLAFIQLAYDGKNGEKIVETIVTHSSGQWLSSGGFSLKPVKGDPQGWGSVVTYEKRYQLSAMFGIASEIDDDGNDASKPQYQRQPVNKTNQAELGRAKEIYNELLKKIKVRYPNYSNVESEVEKLTKENNPNFEKATLVMQYKLKSKTMSDLLNKG